MSDAQATLDPFDRPTGDQFDAIIIGAGITGLYQLYRLRELGLTVRCFDDAGGVGGTWYWNRYPGCRFDSESETYAYSWSEELNQQWDWKEHYSPQPETERYLNHVADTFDLRDDITLNRRVVSADYDDGANLWTVRLDNGLEARSQFLIAAAGIMSARYTPAFQGSESFRGESFHTSRWPSTSVDLAGKRVAVIGTGSTGVQIIPEIAKDVEQLVVFQRTPNYCMPCRNSLVDEDTQREWKANYADIHNKVRETPAGFIHEYYPRSAFDFSAEERLAIYEELWAQPGFKKWLGNFSEIMTNDEINEEFSEFVRNKIRERVKDPVVADKLAPKDHPFGSKRVPLETNYFETFNRDNVLLVDVRETPIESIAATGIQTSDCFYTCDVIIYATGFDAVTGALTDIDIRGDSGQTLSSKWADGPRSNLGVQIAGFPNLFNASNATFCNYTVCAEMLVDWISECIRYMRLKQFTRISPTLEAEESWVTHVNDVAAGLLLNKAKTNWFMGTNIPGKARAPLMYLKSAPGYRKRLVAAAEQGYEGFILE